MGGITHTEGVWKFVYEYGHFREQIYGLYLNEDLCDTIARCVSNPDVTRQHVVISELQMLQGFCTLFHYFLIKSLSLKGQKMITMLVWMSWNLNYVPVWQQLCLSWWWRGRYFCPRQHELLCDVKIAAASKKGQMKGCHRHIIYFCLPTHFWHHPKQCPWWRLTQNMCLCTINITIRILF